MLLAPEFHSRWEVAAFPGYASKTSSYLLVVSRHDPAVTPVVIVCNNRTYTSDIDFSMTELGNAGIVWTGQCVLTGLTPFTRHAFTVTQGTYTNDGSTFTAGGKADSFALFFGSCQQNNQVLSGAWRVEGYWEYVYEYAHTGPLPVQGVFWVDDYAYIDSKEVDDQTYPGYPESDTCTGLVSGGQPQTTLDLNDYAIAWACVFGMVGPAELDVSMFDTWKDTWSPQLSARGELFGWCQRNINLYVNEGDHPYANDIGWEFPSHSVTVANARYNTDGTDGPGKVALDAFLGHLMPPRARDVLDTPRDAAADHWVCELGPVTLAAFDWVTNADGVVGAYAVDALYPATAITTLAGTDQIADVLELVHQYKNPVNLFGMAHSLRYPVSTYDGLRHFRSGAQHPLFDHCIGEFRRLITQTGQTPPSIMDSPYTNGALGFSLMLHGDYHRAHWWKMYKAAYANNQLEELHAIGTGTWDGSTNFPVTDANAVQSTGDTAADMEAVYFDPAANTGQPWETTAFWGVRLDVFADESPVRVVARLQDMDGSDLKAATFFQYAGNLPSDKPPAFAGGISVEI